MHICIHNEWIRKLPLDVISIAHYMKHANANVYAILVERNTRSSNREHAAHNTMWKIHRNEIKVAQAWIPPEIINVWFASFRFVSKRFTKIQARASEHCVFTVHILLKCKCTHLPNEIYGQYGLICLKYLYYHICVWPIPKRGREHQRRSKKNEHPLKLISTSDAHSQNHIHANTQHFWSKNNPFRLLSLRFHNFRVFLCVCVGVMCLPMPCRMSFNKFTMFIASFFAVSPLSPKIQQKHWNFAFCSRIY